MRTACQSRPPVAIVARVTIAELRARFAGEGALVAGVLSGTSADGIDVAIARLCVRGSALEAPEVLAFAIEDYPREVRARVRRILDGESVALGEIARLDRDLGRAFGSAARAVAARERLQLDLVASHGQTVWHHDGVDATGASTLQLGDGDFVAEAAGCAVASDFRQRDIAAGGEGAPVSALADPILFARAARPCVILNLGGMANLTWLGARAQDVLAFDTGPANALLDGLARRFLGASCDRDGEAAARGRVEHALVREFLAHPFFTRPPPKSTGRDTFGEPFVERFVERARAHGLAAGAVPDLLASATVLVAESVSAALARFVPPAARELLVAGGGVHNRALMRALAASSGIPVVSSAERGIDPDAREALVFAILGSATVLELPLTQPSATGARPGRVLGKISPGPSAT
jgi:anhydro-N-acetylmuramic acid kinase